MTQLEQQMLDELGVTQVLTNVLADYLTQKGVAATADEGLDTLVPKVLLITSGENAAYKTEIIAAPANGTTLTLKTGVITVISTVLTSANSFTIAMPTTPISGYINECGLKFKIGASLPTITLPTIAYWRTPQYIPSINTSRVIILERETYDGTTWETYATCDKN